MTKTVTCPHGHAYGTCLMCYHDLVGEQQSEIERLREVIARCYMRMQCADVPREPWHWEVCTTLDNTGIPSSHEPNPPPLCICANGWCYDLQHGQSPKAQCRKRLSEKYGVCAVCGWPMGHCDVGCTAQRTNEQS